MASSKTTDYEEGKCQPPRESKFTDNPSHEVGHSERSSSSTTTTTTTTTTTAGSKSSLGSSHVGRVELNADQQLLHRAVGHLYSKIIQPREEGGWSEWFQEHCVIFDVKKKSEHNLAYTELHKQYEVMVETALVEFTKQEGIDDFQEMYMRILSAIDDKKFESTVNLLLAAADYKKFVALMKRKHRKYIKEGGGAVTQSSSNSSSSSSSSSSSNSNSGNARQASALAVARQQQHAPSSSSSSSHVVEEEEGGGGGGGSSSASFRTPTMEVLMRHK